MIDFPLFFILYSLLLLKEKNEISSELRSSFSIIILIDWFPRKRKRKNRKKKKERNRRRNEKKMKLTLNSEG